MCSQDFVGSKFMEACHIRQTLLQYRYCLDLNKCQDPGICFHATLNLGHTIYPRRDTMVTQLSVAPKELPLSTVTHWKY